MDVVIFVFIYLFQNVWDKRNDNFVKLIVIALVNDDTFMRTK